MFKDHFEHLLDQCDNTIPENQDIETAPYIPILDDPFVNKELETAINSLNQNKSFSGVCPGLLKVFPLPWFMFLLRVSTH